MLVLLGPSFAGGDADYQRLSKATGMVAYDLRARLKPGMWGLVKALADEAEAERLSKSRDLFIARLYTGRGGRYPTVADAEAHPYTAWEQQIVHEARRRRVAGTPEQCRERLEALARDYGVDEIVVVTITETAATRLRSYELLAGIFGLR